MYDIAAVGELLIDFTEAGLSPSGMRLFEQNPGGAPCNALTAAARQGLKAAFIGKVGNDSHGRFLKSTIEEVGVDTKGLVLADDVFTTLAFVSLKEDGEREFAFARKPGADTCLKVEEVCTDITDSCKVFAFGSLSLTDEPSRSAATYAIKRAKEHGAIIAYDPNYRPPLWVSEEAAVEMMRSALPLADIVKVSDEEVKLITGCDDPEEALNAILAAGASVAAITLGAEGVVAKGKNTEMVYCPGYPSANPVDATGAGDCWFGSFISKLLKDEILPEELTKEELLEACDWACAAAAASVEKRGGIPSMPTIPEIEAVIKSK